MNFQLPADFLHSYVGSSCSATDWAISSNYASEFCNFSTDETVSQQRQRMLTSYR